VQSRNLVNEEALAYGGLLCQNKIIIIFINYNWVVTRWQWLYYMYTNMR